MALPNGQILEKRYRIENLLARGGMGAIYRAFDTNLNIPVALKENYFKTPQSIAQFQQEAQILARLHHPNLPRVIQHFSFQSNQYLVMDFIDGQDLWDIIKAKGQPLPEVDALRYIIQVCDAVDYLHRQRPPIIHRDIKPQNIKITSQGQAVLVDFGIAKVAEDGGHTHTGAQGVTPGFSPPEQYSGEGTSPASDTYSLGATLYALLTGKKPPHSVSLLVDQAKFKPPDEINTKLSRQVSQAVMQAMKLKIVDRPASVKDWQGELLSILDTPTQPGQPVDEETLHGMSASPGWLIGPGQLRYRIKPGLQTIGRASSCDVPIQDRRASRQHASVNFDGHTCTVSDAGSANGTFVNNQPVGGAGRVLKEGDRIRIADTTLLFSLTPQPGSVGMAPIVQPVDELAGTVALPDSFPSSGHVIPVAPPPSAPVLVQPTSATPAAPVAAARQNGMPVWVWLGLGVIMLLVVLIVGGTLFLFQQEQVTHDRATAAAMVATQQASTAAALADELKATAVAVSPTETAAGTATPTLEPTSTLEPTPIPTVTPSPKSGQEEVVIVADTPTIPPPTQTFTPTSSPSPNPTATPTVFPSHTPVTAAPLGTFQDFEAENSWKRGDEPNGEFYRSAQQVYSGNYSGQLDYNFTTSANDYVVFLQSRALAGTPKSISAQVYGDGAGHFLNVWIQDAQGQTWQMSFGQVKHRGWQEMTAILSPGQKWPSGHISGPNNGQIDYPITFQGLVLDDGSDDFNGRGTIYIDSLASRSDIVTPQAPSGPTVTAPSSGQTPLPASGLYKLAVGSQHLYEPWGAPVGGDICAAFRNGSFNDKIQMKGFNIELSLTNYSTRKVEDDWQPEFITAKGRSVQVCYYGYAGSGPQPGATSYVTFFTIVEPDDYVREVLLEVNGEQLQLCLTLSGAEVSCQ
jgi:serine/threonine protein kinase